MDALESSGSTRDSAVVYTALVGYYLTKGQAAQSLDAHKKMAEKYKIILPPKDYMVFRIFSIDPYIIAGEIDEALALLDHIARNWKRLLIMWCLSDT